MRHRPILPSPDRLAKLPADVIASSIEELIAVLDAREGDVDLEDSEAGETSIDERGRYLFEQKAGFDLEGRPWNLETEDNEKLLHRMAHPRPA